MPSVHPLSTSAQTSRAFFSLGLRMVHRAVWKRPAEEPGEQASPSGDAKRRALPPAAQCAAEHGSAVQCPFAAPGAAPLLLTAPDSDGWHSSNSPAAEALMNTDPRELMRAASTPADFSGDLEFLKKISKLTPRHDTSLPYLDERQKIVKFIICVCEGLKLQAVTAHRSVNYFDRLLHGAREISRAVLKLFATASILIAGLQTAQGPFLLPCSCFVLALTFTVSSQRSLRSIQHIAPASASSQPTAKGAAKSAS